MAVDSPERSAAPPGAEDQQRVLERLTVLAQVTTPVVGIKPLPEQMRSRLELVRASFDVDATIVRTLEGNELVLLASVGIPHAQLRERLPAHGGLFGKMAQERRALAVENVAEDPFTARLARAAQYDDSKFQFISYAGAPLFVDHELVGLLGLYCTRRPRRFSQLELEHLQVVANHIAISILNDRLYRELVARTSQLHTQMQEREVVEAQLRQAQKLEAIGQLAGGVAHDFNNIVTAILGNVELGLECVRTELGGNHTLVETLEQIEQVAQRAARLTRQLLTFSRRGVVKPEVLNLNDILAQLDKMLRRLITEDIVFDTVTEPQLMSVFADAGQLEQVIVNLVVNAVHAMPDGGRLTLETQNVILDDDYLHHHAEARPGPHVLLAVSDTGHGMDAATRERIFDPFFTTKAPDKGTGLGLATVHGIVKQSGGHIMVYSEPGHGTTFKIYLPATAALPAEPAPAAPLVTASRGCETILLCEDDDPVRELIAQSLRTAGYTVLTAGSGQAGLAAAQAHPGPLDLLITDVIMPEMNGRVLSDHLRMLRPDLPTLFVSGYTSNIIAHHGVLNEGFEFLEKPFTRHRLLEKVRAVLSRTRTDVGPPPAADAAPTR